MTQRAMVLILTVLAELPATHLAFAQPPSSEPKPAVAATNDAKPADSKPDDAKPADAKPEESSAGKELANDRAASPEEFATLAKVLEDAYGSDQPPESVRMLIAIAKGSQMGPGDGWFGPSQSRYSWEWLAKFHEIDVSTSLTADKFRGKPELFARLDRNKDGSIAAEDFDWSDRNPFVQQSYMINRMFRRIDQEGDGKVTRDELQTFFQRLAGEKDSFRSEDLRDELIGGPSGFLPGDAPSPPVLLRGLFRGEIGSLNEGPRVGDPAPDFSLATYDGSRTIRLHEQLGTKPVVLVFGNFTCGPFRSMYPMVDEICQRYQDEANFLSIYVREAHPSDGWHMESNAKVGVSVSQPQSYAERSAVAQQCHAKLKYSMPLLVDEMHDPVGNAYSGMPARLYVIDTNGKVVYKSGRGPFGFKSGEMEQALAMTLMDRSNSNPAPASP